MINRIDPRVEFADLFDLSNIDLDFEFKASDKPIRTKAGKLGLRV